MSSAPHRCSKFLSIVTISFNQAEYLVALLDSIRAQKNGDIEHVVQDPGSTDGSRGLLEAAAADGSIDKLLLQRDSGPGDGLNRGFAEASGEIGYFINSDDLLLPGAITRLRALWRDHPDADIILGAAWMVDGDGLPLRRLRAPSHASIHDFLTDRAVLVQQGMSFRMEWFRKIGGFNSANSTCWDYELLCRMLAAGARAVTVPTVIGAFRMSGQNLSSGAGGVAHQQRFRADKARILRDLAGQEQPRGALRRSWSRLAKHFADPIGELDALADRFVPGRMLRRWQHELANGS
jgi:glycosyltransferase involved in cell wall biosynthesis